ncbi:MAG: DsbA family protein [Bdellovibrionales bacterium]
MKQSLKLFAVLALAAFTALSPSMAKAGPMTNIPSMGSPTAPVTIVEYASLTCSHCADFYNEVMPEIEKRYVDTGKVRFIYRDFPLDAYGLHAATLAHCMPNTLFYPFIKILFKNQRSWIMAPKYKDVLVKYAEMSGLPSARATSCIQDTKLMDQVIAVRTEASQKYDITATPTFIINDGEEKILGARSLKEFASVIDKHLAKKK